MRLLCLTLPAIVAAALASAGDASAGFIISTMPTNPGAVSSTPQVQYAILTVVNVGASNVTINSFGTFGQLNNAGNLKFIIFDTSTISAPTLVYTSASITSAAATLSQWYDSPNFSYTLLANKQYRLGVISNQSFTYREDNPGITVTGGGLTTPAGTNGVAAGFANPVYQGGGSVLNSFRAFQNDAIITATPSPPTLPAGIGIMTLLGLGRMRSRRAWA